MANKHFNRHDIEILTKRMLTEHFAKKKKTYKGKLPTRIDIEDFVITYLGCNIIYETIVESMDCMGFIADGTTPLRIQRNGVEISFVFPENTIVIDRYLLTEGQECKRRFTIGHEAGHIIHNRLCNTTGAQFNHDGALSEEMSVSDFAVRLSYGETEANLFSAALLMPAHYVDHYMEQLFGKSLIKRYGDVIDPSDKAKLISMAEWLGVSLSALIIRLDALKKFENRPLEEYLRANGIGGES